MSEIVVSSPGAARPGAAASVAAARRRARARARGRAAAAASPTTAASLPVLIEAIDPWGQRGRKLYPKARSLFIYSAVIEIHKHHKLFHRSEES